MNKKNTPARWLDTALCITSVGAAVFAGTVLAGRMMGWEGYAMGAALILATGCVLRADSEFSEAEDDAEEAAARAEADRLAFERAAAQELEDFRAHEFARYSAVMDKEA